MEVLFIVGNIMMSFFDYLFYRIYKINYPNDIPLSTGIIYTLFILEGLTTPIWYGISLICYGYTSKPGPLGWIFIGLIGIALTYRYVKKKKEILIRFENSKYNIWIPFWVIQIFMLLCIAFGIFIAASFVEPYIESHNLVGYLCKYIPGFLK